jgi:hypothetical protein
LYLGLQEYVEVILLYGIHGWTHIQEVNEFDSHTGRNPATRSPFGPSNKKGNVN